ncbi:MAG: ankyrin repeat domain-containing protein [Campylobacterota bacterium]
MSLIQAIYQGNEPVLKQLLQSGHDTAEADEEGNSAFHLAIKNDIDLEIIKAFADAGVDLFACSPEGVGAMDIAIEAGRLDVVQYLHGLGYDLNTSKRDSGMTPLMIAACYNKVDIARYLVLQDADVCKRDASGLQAVDYARKLGQNAMVEFLRRVED